MYWSELCPLRQTLARSLMNPYLEFCPCIDPLGLCPTTGPKSTACCWPRIWTRRFPRSPHHHSRICKINLKSISKLVHHKFTCKWKMIQKFTKIFQRPTCCPLLKVILHSMATHFYAKLTRYLKFLTIKKVNKPALLLFIKKTCAHLLTTTIPAYIFCVHFPWRHNFMRTFF